MQSFPLIGSVGILLSLNLSQACYRYCLRVNFRISFTTVKAVVGIGSALRPGARADRKGAAPHLWSLKTWRHIGCRPGLPVVCLLMTSLTWLTTSTAVLYWRLRYISREPSLQQEQVKFLFYCSTGTSLIYHDAVNQILTVQLSF